jgi:Putative lumazine-binding
MKIARIVTVTGLITLAVTPAATAQTDDEADVLAAIKTMFDGLAARDTAMMSSVLDADTRLVQTFTRNGEPGFRSASMNQFLDNIVNPGPPIREDFFNPKIVIHDNLATVWVDYTFYVDGEVSHCGEDTFQLARQTTGWVIVAIADTQRREGCG